MITPEPINARFVGGPLDGETHRLAHRLPYVQVPGPGESFFARLWIERPAECGDDRLYQVESADDPQTLVYRLLADWPDAPLPPGANPDSVAEAFGLEGSGSAAATAGGSGNDEAGDGPA